MLFQALELDVMAEIAFLTMGSHNLVCRKPGFPFKGVNVLCKAAKEQSFLVEQGHEVVGRCRLVFPWKEFLHNLVQVTTK